MTMATTTSTRSDNKRERQSQCWQCPNEGRKMTNDLEKKLHIHNIWDRKSHLLSQKKMACGETDVIS